nr:MAG TPA: hypothetical protein [Caudoviricetes sp.]
MVTKAHTYIHNEYGELVFLPEGSELSDHVLSQVTNPDITGLRFEEPAEEPAEEPKKAPARKGTRSRANSK